MRRNPMKVGLLHHTKTCNCGDTARLQPQPDPSHSAKCAMTLDVEFQMCGVLRVCSGATSDCADMIRDARSLLASDTSTWSHCAVSGS